MQLPNRRLCLVALLLAICSSLQNGCISSVLNIPQFVVEQFVNRSEHHLTGHYLGRHKETWLWSAIVTQRQLGQFLGTVICPFMTQACGRKKTILWNTVPLVLGNFLQFISKFAEAWELLLLGRLVWGVGCGVVACVIPIFLSEIAPNRYRGLVACMHGMFIGFGSFFADLISLPEFLGTPNSWSVIYFVILLFQLVQFAIFRKCPESPKELYIRNGDTEKAVESLKFYQGAEEDFDLQGTLEQYELEKINYVQSGGFPWKELLKNPDFRMSIIVGIGSACCYAFGGMQIVTNYTTEIFVNMRVSHDMAGKASLALGALRFFAVFPAMYIVERHGRRRLLLGSVWCCVGCFTLLLIFQEIHDHSNLRGLGGAAIVVAMVYGISFSIGCQTVGTFLASEVITTRERSANQSIAVMCRFVIAFVTTLSFLPAQRNVGGLSWLILIVPLALTGLLMYKCMPETKDRPISEILHELNTRRSLFSRHKMQALVNEPDSQTELHKMGGYEPGYGTGNGTKEPLFGDQNLSDTSDPA